MNEGKIALHISFLLLLFRSLVFHPLQLTSSCFCCARLGYASNYLTTPTESRRFVVPSGTKSWYLWSAASQVTPTWHCQCQKKTSHQSSCYLLDLANARMKSYPRYCSCSQVPTYFWGKIFLILVLSCLAPSLPQPPGVFHESLHSSCGHYHWK